MNYNDYILFAAILYCTLSCISLFLEAKAFNQDDFDSYSEFLSARITSFVMGPFILATSLAHIMIDVTVRFFLGD